MRRRLRPVAPRSRRLALITGGAGFIGTNIAARLLESGSRVRILDNLSQVGVETNLQWLCATYGSGVDPVVADIRHRPALKAALDGVSQVYHLAAQVAFDSGVGDPILDFSVNAGGTLNLLEELRALAAPPSLLFASTKSVYGALDDVDLVREGDRYVPASPRMRDYGISERRRVAFQSPYACSKGAADQYVLNYASMFGLPAVLFRLSCIYGPHHLRAGQHGWVAQFIVRALERQPITIYGEGLQVRDVLFIDDLVDAMITAHDRIHDTAGEAFNVGGGAGRSISLIELVNRIEKLDRRRPHVEYEIGREGDQRYYVSDTRKFHAATGWEPRTTLDVGVSALFDSLQTGRAVPVRVAL
jgi:CDP-paratose 2-epimerase